MRNIVACILILPLFVLCGSLPAHAESPYVGSAACGECHEKEYSNFQKLSQRPNAFKSVQKMANKLSPEEVRNCYSCHTTGYGKGGFVDFKTTPHLADAGCETCHGPGRAHVESGGDPEQIVAQPRHDTCLSCHDESRGVARHRFTGTIFSGAH